MAEKENYTSPDRNSASSEAEFRELDGLSIAKRLAATSVSMGGYDLFEHANHSVVRIRELITRTAESAASETGVDYEASVQALIEYANSHDDDRDKSAAYIAGLTVSLFDPNPHHRVTFIKTMYETGQNTHVSNACTDHTGLSIEVGEYDPAKPQSHQLLVHDLAAAFALPREDLESYMSRLDSKITKEPLLFSPSELQAELFHVPTDFQDIEYLRSKAKEASVADEKVAGLQWDIYKIERFALQQKFMAEQMRMVLGDDISNTPFARLLTERPASQYNGDEAREGNKLEQLVADITEAFRELTEPVAEEYDPDIIDDENDLTEKHRVALRYREIANYSKGIQTLGHYLDPKRFRQENIRTAPIHYEIWMGSEAGAAIGEFMQRFLEPMANAARLQRENLTITPHDIRRLLHDDRRQLADIPMLNMSDFLLYTNIGFVDPLQVLTRDDKGELHHLKPLKLEYGGKTDMYAGATLGCIAARLVHPERSEFSQSQRHQYGYVNYIDHIMALVINEAHRRGIFGNDTM